MSTKPNIPAYKGRSIGIVALTVAQIAIGFIHLASGIWLMGAELAAGAQFSITYDVYTLAFGASILVFAFFIWQQEKIGWAGTMAVSLLVILADGLTLLDLPSIPGIPKAPAYTEIAYSVVVVGYLFTAGVRKKFLG